MNYAYACDVKVMAGANGKFANGEKHGLLSLGHSFFSKGHNEFLATAVPGVGIRETIWYTY